MTRLVLGIAGQRGAGKTLLAKRLASHHGFRIVSPIDPAKRLAAELGFTEASLWGSSSARQEPHPQFGVTARAFLDALGVAIRDVHPELLLAAAMRGDDDVVNESVRFLGEAEAIRAAGGKIIRRRGGEYIGDAYDEMAAMPDSYFDAIVDHHEDVESMWSQVAIIVDGWRSELDR